MKNLRSSETTTTNEEAFKSWFDNQIWGNESWEDGLRESWQAAIAYMQEQNKSTEQSEPVATIYNGNAYWIGKEPPEGINLFTAPQRQQPLKRLSEDEISLMAFNDDQNDWDSLQFKECWHEGYIEGAKAIMDAMQELNK